MIADQAWQIALKVPSPPPPYYHAVGGSTFQEIGTRILCKPELRANPLLIWDGSANGHVNGSAELELRVLDELAAFKRPNDNWLLILPIVVPPATGLPADPQQIKRDIERFSAEAGRRYGSVHLYDLLPELQKMGNGSPEDAAYIKDGYPPRSILADGLHLTFEAKQKVAAVLTAPDGPMERVARLGARSA